MIIHVVQEGETTAYVKLAPQYGFYGVGVWNIMRFFPQMWLVINSQYEIEKVV